MAYPYQSKQIHYLIEIYVLAYNLPYLLELQYHGIRQRQLHQKQKNHYYNKRILCLE